MVGPGVTIEVYHFEACGMPHTVAFGPSMYFEAQNLPIYKIILDARRSKRGYHLSLYQSKEKIWCHVSGQILSLTTSYSF